MNLAFRKNIDEHNIRRAYQPFLFNTQNHRSVQRDEGWHSFYLIDESSGELQAEFHGNLLGETLKSPAMSPFAGFNFSPNLPQGALEQFLRNIEADLVQLKIQEITIKSAPEAYQASSSQVLNSAFQDNGFKCSYNDPHWVIQVKDFTFEHQLKSAEYKRRLRKLIRQGYVFSVEGLTRSREIWDFIVTCRQERKYRFSMTYKLFEKYIHTNPDSVKLFGVRYEGQLCAAAICFQVNTESLYDFSHGHLRKFDKSSPVLLLIAGIYDFCQSEKISILDLGASSIAKKPNYPLISFKESLGAVSSPKYIWKKEVL